MAKTSFTVVVVVIALPTDGVGRQDWPSPSTHTAVEARAAGAIAFYALAVTISHTGIGYAEIAILLINS